MVNGTQPAATPFVINAWAPQQQESCIGVGALVSLTPVAAAALNVDCRLGSLFGWTMPAGTITRVNFLNPQPGQVICCKVKQDATGSRTVTAWNAVLFTGGTAPTLTTTAGALDYLQFLFNDALQQWVGFAPALNVS